MPGFYSRPTEPESLGPGCMYFFPIDFRERGGLWGTEGKREKEISICPTYLCIYWLIFVCVLIRDQTCSLGVW